MTSRLHDVVVSAATHPGTIREALSDAAEAHRPESVTVLGVACRLDTLDRLAGAGEYRTYMGVDHGLRVYVSFTEHPNLGEDRRWTIGARIDEGYRLAAEVRVAANGETLEAAEALLRERVREIRDALTGVS